jgi:hypothetical protein
MWSGMRRSLFSDATQISRDPVMRDPLMAPIVAIATASSDNHRLSMETICQVEHNCQQSTKENTKQYCQEGDRWNQRATSVIPWMAGQDC